MLCHASVGRRSWAFKSFFQDADLHQCDGFLVASLIAERSVTYGALEGGLCEVEVRYIVFRPCLVVSMVTTFVCNRELMTVAFAAKTVQFALDKGARQTRRSALI